MAVKARVSRLGFYALVLEGLPESLQGRSFHSQVFLVEWGGGNGLEFVESNFSNLPYQSPLGSVKAARWAVSPRKGSCIPESTGFKTESGEGWPDFLLTEQLAFC